MSFSHRSLSKKVPTMSRIQGTCISGSLRCSPSKYARWRATAPCSTMKMKSIFQKKTLRIMYWMLHFSEASRVRPCWPGDLKLHKEFQFPVGHSKDILPFDLGFCCAANRVKALAWVEQVQWRQPFQGEHAVCSGVDAEMNDPPTYLPKRSKKVPNMFLPYWRLTKELPSTHGRKRATWTKQYSSTSPRQQGNQNHHETSNMQFLNYSNIMILDMWY